MHDAAAVTISPVRRALVRQLTARAGEIADSLTAVVEDRVERLGGDEWVRSSAQTNIELLLQVMASPEDLVRVVPPLGGVALARRLAAREVPLYELMRGYQHAESYWVQQCVRELATLTTDPDTLVAEVVEVSDLVRSYIDVVCRGLSVEYEAERERWRAQDASARMGLVTALLDGTTTDVAEAEAVLGYRLGQWHQAAVVWFAGPPGSSDATAEITRAVAALGRLVLPGSRPLVVARDHTTQWVWLTVPGRTPPDVAAIGDVLPAVAPHVRIAVGDPNRGLDGFIASHRQATAAYEVGLVAGSEVGPVFPSRVVSSLAFLCADLPRARAWVAEILGPLAAAEEREAELRHTVATYTAANCSATAAARLMNCHKNTIQYRIRAAERLLGRRVEDGGLDLDLALLARRWLGEAVRARP
jgi:DNA-binding PucR family transcriptional regulator